jgi:hypothetical protein
MAKVVEHLPSTGESLSSNPRIANRKKRKGKPIKNLENDSAPKNIVNCITTMPGS